MDIEGSATRRSTRWDIIAAACIAVLVALMLLVVMQHPVARQSDAAELSNSIASQAAAIRLVHGTVAVAMTLMTSLMLGFAARLGLDRPHVMLGAVASILALVMICLAVLLDGFVAPALAVRCVESGGDCAEGVRSLLKYGGLQIEFMTRLGLFALAGAAALWGGELFFRTGGARLAGLLGLASAALQTGILLLSGTSLNPHSLTLIVASQSIWYLSVGAVILFRQGPYANDKPA